MTNRTNSYKQHVARANVEDELMGKILAYADDNEIKQSPAVRKLIILGLRYEAVRNRGMPEIDEEIAERSQSARERRLAERANRVEGHRKKRVDEARIGALSELGAMERNMSENEKVSA